MIDSGIKIIDRIIKLATYKEKKSREFFVDNVDPLYKEAEKITSDYIKLIQELIHKIKANDSEEELIRWLEQRRVECLPVRMKVRAMLNHEHSQHLKNKLYQKHKDKFEEGILSLMRGGLSIVEPGRTGKNKRHTVLGILYGVMYGQIMDPSNMHNSYLKSAEYQMQVIQEAWNLVNEGYMELKAQLL